MNTLIPCLRYEDAPAAIDFLCRAFGLTRRVVYADPHNPAIIHHAELTLGDSMVMLGSARPAAASAPYTWRTPREAGGVTSVICAIIDDPDTHAALARDAGATILTPPHDNPGFPGRSYDACDTEGNIWSFSNYDPFTGAVKTPPA
jgi:uncharacterized glyoxalase superfamily protein PhnB